MHILRKLTLANLRQNRKRSIFTILGILLSAALICAVAGMVTTGHRFLIDQAKVYSGDHHMMFLDVPGEAVTYVRDNPNVDNCYYLEDVGYAQMPENLEQTETFYHVLAATSDAMERSPVNVTEGRMPRTADEIALDENVVSRAGLRVSLGDSVTLEVGAPVPDEQGDPAGVRDAVPRSYTVVGFIECQYGDFTNQYENYLALTQLPDDAVGMAGRSYIVAATYAQPKLFQEITDRITATIEQETGAQVGTVKNMDLLEYQGVLAEPILRSLYLVGAIIIAIVIGCSVFVIRNSFSISVAEKTKQYGMLASVGATSRQIRGAVLYEGFLLGLIGIPLGVGLGVAAIAVLVQVLNALLGPMISYVTFRYSVPPYVLLATVVLGAVTIYLSCLIPAVRASRIAPIVAIRANNEVKLSGRRLKTSRLTKKLFGVGGVIASKNLKRSRSKYRTTVVSLVVSIAVFVALSSFVNYTRDSVGMFYIDADWNIAVSAPSAETYDAVISRLGLQDYSYAYTNAGSTDLNAYGSDYSKENLSTDGNALTSAFVILDRVSFEQFAREQGVRSDFASAAILSDKSLTQQADGSKVVERFYSDKLREGDVIPFTFDVGESGATTVDVTITKRTDTRPMGYERYFASGGIVVVSEDYLDGKLLEFARLNLLYLHADDADTMENRLMTLRAEGGRFAGMEVENAESIVQQEKNLILVIEIFLYGFIVVITLIGVTNVFNTISTNMLLRSKEFAMLRSVGMTNTEFNRMIRLESLLYGSKSLIIGLPLGILGSLAITKGMMGVMDLGYSFPLRAIYISIVCVFIIVWLTMRYSMRKIGRQNIVETIRSENY